MAHSHNTKEFRLMRSVVLWLHNFKCFICGHTSNDLHVHHINTNNQNNEIINLMPICANCHKWIHKVNNLAQFSYSKIIVLLLRKIELFSILKNK